MRFAARRFFPVLILLCLLAGCKQTAAVPAPTPSPVQAVTAMPSPSAAPLPEQTAPAPTPTEKTASSCTLSITCEDLLDRLEDLPDAVRELVPADGILLAPTQVEFAEGETVFDVLQRSCKDLGIPLEFSMTPAYGSAYVEGIGNLYETDCGPLSGWSYTVGGVSPNYGCSQYALSDGDVVCWAYHCELTGT